MIWVSTLPLLYEGLSRVGPALIQEHVFLLVFRLKWLQHRIAGAGELLYCKILHFSPTPFASGSHAIIPTGRLREEWRMVDWGRNASWSAAFFPPWWQFGRGLSESLWTWTDLSLLLLHTAISFFTPPQHFPSFILAHLTPFMGDVEAPIVLLYDSITPHFVTGFYWFCHGCNPETYETNIKWNHNACGLSVVLHFL